MPPGVLTHQSGEGGRGGGRGGDGDTYQILMMIAIIIKSCPILPPSPTHGDDGLAARALMASCGLLRSLRLAPRCSHVVGMSDNAWTSWLSDVCDRGDAFKLTPSTSVYVTLANECHNCHSRATLSVLAIRVRYPVISTPSPMLHGWGMSQDPRDTCRAHHGAHRPSRPLPPWLWRSVSRESVRILRFEDRDPSMDQPP